VSGLVLTLLAMTGITLVVCLLVVVLGVVPFVLAGDVAERSGFSAFRWGAVTVLGELAMAALVYQVFTADWSKLLLLPAVLLPWVGLTVLSLLGPEERLVGGVPGAHQR
jgi:hypothetical protein